MIKIFSISELKLFFGFLVDKNDQKIMLRIFLIFVPQAFILVMIHELGHYTWAYNFGYEPILHYASVSLENFPENAGNTPEIMKDLIGVTLAGPILNMVVGTIGIIWLWLLRRHGELTYPVKPQVWAAIVLTVLWGRELLVGAGGLLILMVGVEVETIDDWHEIAKYWELSPWIIFFITGAIGSIICLLILWWFPRSHWKHLAVGGPAGCIFGIVVWLGGIGPLVLP